MNIHEKPHWTDFYWNKDEVTPLVDKVRIAQGHLYGRLLGLGFDKQLLKVAENLTADIIRSSEIEGIELNMDQVRSSDTANRDLQDLCQKGLIKCDDESAKRRAYHLVLE